MECGEWSCAGGHRRHWPATRPLFRSDAAVRRSFGRSGGPFKTWLKDAPVLWRDSGPALMGQPNFHTGELPQQPSELFEYPIAGRTQPWIVGWQIHALLLS